MSTQDDDVVGKAYDARLMRRLLAYLRPYRIQAALALAAIIANSMLQLAQPYLMKLAIDRFIPAGDLAGVDRIALWFFAILIASFALEFTQTWLLQTTGQRIMFDMRMQIYAHLQRLDLRFYDRNPVGRLMTRVTTDVDVINDLFTSGVVSIFGDVFTLAGIMIVMLTMNWQLALVSFAVLPLIVVVTQWFRRNVRESYRTVRRLIARINAYLQEHITGMGTVQLFRPRGARLRAVRGDQPGAPQRQRRFDLLLRRVLSGDRNHRRARGGADDLVRRPIGPRQHAHARLAGGVPALLAALLPAHLRHVGKVQHPAGGDGLVRADLQAARRTGDAFRSPEVLASAEPSSSP